MQFGFLMYVVAAVLLSACDRPENTTHRPSAPTLRGPLAEFVAHRPSSLASCDAVATQYAVPFWRGPYRSCAYSGADANAHEVVEVDADTVVTQVVDQWRVPGTVRDERFLAAETELSRRYGPGFRCGPYRMVWLTRDSLRVSLDLRPAYETDVGPLPPADSVPWRLQRFMRRGPIIDLFWCDSARQHLGA